MKVKSTSIKDVLLITPEIFEDSRGHFFESFNEKEFSSIIGRSFLSVQDNQSYSLFGTLRGIHLQKAPMAQAKIVRVLEGEIFDVAVDLREDSNTYCEWIGEYLSSDNNQQLYIPEGFGHAFVVTSKNARSYTKSITIILPNMSKVLNLMILHWVLMAGCSVKFVCKRFSSRLY